MQKLNFICTAIKDRVSSEKVERELTTRIQAQRAAGQDSVDLPTGRVTLTHPGGDCELRACVSAHVDDLKGAATKAVALSLLKHLEDDFGPCKAEWDSFLHVGIQHDHRPGEVYCHQNQNIDSLHIQPRRAFWQTRRRTGIYEPTRGIPTVAGRSCVVRVNASGCSSLHTGFTAKRTSSSSM